MEPNFNLRNKNILVTGGAGFIGSNLCEYLLTCEANVTCLDNFCYRSQKYNIEEFLDHSKFTLIEGDIRDLETCQQACKGQEFILRKLLLDLSRDPQRSYYIKRGKCKWIFKYADCITRSKG